jgi:hypothetical protein
VYGDEHHISFPCDNGQPFFKATGVDGMKLFQSAALLLAMCVPALGQAGPKPTSCKYSFGFMYTDKLGNKYDSVQGKELKEIQQRIAKKQHGDVCVIDEGLPDYIFSVRAKQGSRIVDGNELYFNQYTLEIHRGKDPFELEHVFARSTLPGVRAANENRGIIIDLVEDAAKWLSENSQ